MDAALEQLYDRRGGSPPTALEHLLLRNPRDTMRTFIEEMGRFELNGRTNALRTLDLEHFGLPLQKEDANLLAHYLKQVLDRIGYILYQEIPNDPDQHEVYVHFRHGAGNIIITPKQKKPWKAGGSRVTSLSRNSPPKRCVSWRANSIIPLKETRRSQSRRLSHSDHGLIRWSRATQYHAVSRLFENRFVARAPSAAQRHRRTG